MAATTRRRLIVLLGFADPGPVELVEPGGKTSAVRFVQVSGGTPELVAIFGANLPDSDDSITINLNGKPVTFKAEPNLGFLVEQYWGVVQAIRSNNIQHIPNVRCRLFVLAMSGVRPGSTLEAQIGSDLDELMGDKTYWLGPRLGAPLFPYINQVARAISRAKGSFVSGIIAVLGLYALSTWDPNDDLEEPILRAVQFWGAGAPCPIPGKKARLEGPLARVSVRSLLRIALNFVPIPISKEYVIANKTILASLIPDIWPYIDVGAVPEDRQKWLFELLGREEIISEIALSVPIQFLDWLPFGKGRYFRGKSVWDTFLDAESSAIIVRPDLAYFQSLIGEVYDGVLVEPNMQPPSEEFRWLGPDAVVRRPCGCDAHLAGTRLPQPVAIVPYGGTNEAHTLLDMGARPKEQIFTLSTDTEPHFWRQARSVFLSKELAKKINSIATKSGKAERWKLILAGVRQQLINAGLHEFVSDYMDPGKSLG